jgi:hypothetical protein
MVAPGQARMGALVNEFSRSLSFCREYPGDEFKRHSRNARPRRALVNLLLTLLFS